MISRKKQTIKILKEPGRYKKKRNNKLDARKKCISQRKTEENW